MHRARRWLTRTLVVLAGEQTSNYLSSESMETPKLPTQKIEWRNADVSSPTRRIDKCAQPLAPHLKEINPCPQVGGAQNGETPADAEASLDDVTVPPNKGEVRILPRTLTLQPNPTLDRACECSCKIPAPPKNTPRDASSNSLKIAKAERKHEDAHANLLNTINLNTRDGIAVPGMCRSSGLRARLNDPPPMKIEL